MIDTDMKALLGYGASFVRVARRGKQPLGKAWHTLASTAADVVGQWLAGGYNVGLLLGGGGLVDVEYDDDDGRDAVARLGLLTAQTPTWSSGRGEHRLFRLAGMLPPCGWRKIGGLEIRLGGKPAQSVLPPSTHPNGQQYGWRIPPHQCEPMLVTLDDLGISRSNSDEQAHRR